MSTYPNCVFCDILAGKRPASFVFEDDICTAFLDIQPINRGHVLVIPNRHAAHLADLDPEVGAHMFKIAQRVALALRGSRLGCDGVNLFLADGSVAGQEVMHVHLHILPRYRNDEFWFRLGAEYGRQPPRQELDEIAKEIREAL
jgi:histidine triad (HIT) family protein